MKKFSLMNALVMFVVAWSAFCSCEKMVLDEGSEVSAPEGNVTLRVSGFNIVPFDSRAVQNIADYCTRLHFVIFKADGTHVKTVTQKKGDDNYGQVSISLDPATYKLLVLAHSSSGNPENLTKPDQIHFTNTTGYSDTFYYYNDLVVTSEDKTHSLTLERATTMVKFTITDELPAALKTVRCEWKGESGVFNATTGWGGTTNSDQVVLYDVSGLTAPLTFRLYTFMRQDEGTLTLNVRALSDAGVIAEKTFTDVPIKNHMVTEYSGNFFSTPASSNGFSLTAETSWNVYQQITF